MSAPRRSVMQGGRADALFGALWLAVLALLMTMAFLLAVAPGVHLLLRLGAAMAALLAAAWLRYEYRATFPAEGRLRIDVTDDAIQLLMPHDRSDTIRRADVELIVIQESVFGVDFIWVYGHDEELLGIWTTNWVLKPPQLLMRVLKRHGYPYALSRWRYGNRRFYRSPGRPPRADQPHDASTGDP
ncbi:MAG TPA: hypothetical protein VGR11_08300 [Solirubrobacteraceae bacterium]|nr:hypothetical protein [Solirubrobacteraceae bacterium]